MKLTPTKYDVCECPVINGGLIDPESKPDFRRGSQRITIEQRMPDGSSWALCNGDRTCFSKSQFQFIYEPMPSSRDDDFLEDCRFSSPEEALAFWEEHWENYAYYPAPIFRFVERPDGGVDRVDLTEEDQRKAEAAEAFYAEKGLAQV